MADFQKGWESGLPETPCGRGSMRERTFVQRATLPAWVAEFHIRSLVDIGAGDLNWISLIKWPHALEYIPLDLVPRHHDVRQFDVIYDVPPAADCGMCLWLLNHLPEHQAKAALGNIQQAGYKYLIYTWWPAMADFLNLGYHRKVTVNPVKSAELRLLCC